MTGLGEVSSNNIYGFAGLKATSVLVVKKLIRVCLTCIDAFQTEMQSDLGRPRNLSYELLH